MPASRTHKGYALPEEVLSWFDVHFEPSDPNGRISLACRNAIGAMRQIYIGPPAKIRTILSEFRCKPRYDYYLSANGFTGMKRSSASLMILQNLVVDVDCHDRDLSACDREDLLERFRGWFFKDALLDLPMPTSLVHTGRGLQLWWHLHPLPACRRELLTEILDFFLGRIAFLLDDYETTRLTVDSAATRNLAGLFRLPGSTHSGTGARVRIERMPGDPVYDGEQLLALVRERKADLALDTEEKSGSFLWSRPPKVSLAGQYTPAERRIFKGYRRASILRVNQLITLRKLRQAASGKETRDLYNLLFYCAVLPLGEEEAWEKLQSFNAGFQVPMTEAELRGTICSAQRKGGYIYSNRRMVQVLSITPEEQEAIGLYTPSPGEVRQRWNSDACRHFAASLVRDERKPRTEYGQFSKDDWKIPVLRMALEGQKGTEIADALETSSATISRCTQEWHLKECKALLASRMEEAGFSRREICSRLRCTGQFYASLLKRAAALPDDLLPVLEGNLQEAGFLPVTPPTAPPCL